MIKPLASSYISRDTTVGIKPLNQNDNSELTGVFQIIPPKHIIYIVGIKSQKPLTSEHSGGGKITSHYIFNYLPGNLSRARGGLSLVWVGRCLNLWNQQIGLHILFWKIKFSREACLERQEGPLGLRNNYTADEYSDVATTTQFVHTLIGVSLEE